MGGGGGGKVCFLPIALNIYTVYQCELVREQTQHN